MGKASLAHLHSAETLRHYLEHDKERIDIAAAGQRRTLGEHTYVRRTAQLVEMLQSRL